MTLSTKKIMIMVLCCISSISCQEAAKQEPDKTLMNIELISSYNDIALQNAIVSQHTMFPYHFVKNSAQLNELGKRDLDVLAGHFMKYPGDLNIRRHDTPAELYVARVNAVVERVQQAGVEIERINVADAMPGGSGMTSERILIILEKAYQATSSTSTTTTQSQAR